MRYLAALCVLLPSLAFGQTKAATISGPTTAAVGTLVELKASSDISSNMTWLAVGDVSYKTYESNRVLVFASPKPGRFEFALVVVAVTTDGKPIVSIEKTSVEIRGDGPVPVPPPPPVPPPGPSPSLFPELVEIAKRTAPADKRADVANNFRTVATMLAAGTISGWQQLVSDTATRNRNTVGDAKDANHPWHGFMKEIGTKLDELSKNTNRLKNREEWQAAWNAIAEGLSP